MAAAASKAAGRSRRFAGRAALVTGAGSGMGLAIAQALAREGCSLAGLDLRERPEDFPADALYYSGDVRDETVVEAAVGQIYERSGRLDCLVNAAAVLWFGRDLSMVETDLAVWREVLEINLTSMAITARFAVPLMRKTGGGAMLHISSIQALRGDDRPQDAYQASKAAMLSLSKSLAIQFAADNIRSNCLLPGATETAMQARWEHDPKLKREAARRVPLGRVGRVEDMANAALFLLSDEASFITGTELVVDGGMTARP